MAQLQQQTIKQKLLENDDMLEAQQNQLLDAQKNLAETEQIGINVCGNLRDQRVKLENADKTIKDTTKTVRQVDRIAKQMTRRQILYRLALLGTAFLLFIAIIASLIYKLAT